MSPLKWGITIHTAMLLQLIKYEKRGYEEKWEEGRRLVDHDQQSSL